VILVAAVAGLATVQDAGRPGHMHEGVPPGGPLVPELLGRANAAVRNRVGEAGLEVFGTVTLAASGGPVLLATDDGTPHELQPGMSWTASSAGARVRYVAVRGGIDVPVALGGRGTLLVAGLGGHEGRPLRRGDRLPLGIGPPCDRVLPAAPDLTGLVPVVLGPDVDCFDAATVDLLRSATFLVDPRSDRVGVRLSGPALRRMPASRHDEASTPMVRGAIQVPPSGAPIVLGPDHPTTGGYPVIATVTRAAFGALTARTPGAPVCFTFVMFAGDRTPSP
jgi:biotin-dependent carboxylase-like uncharacterized protein